MSDANHSAPTQRHWNREILRLAGPIVLANLSVPLLGITDTAVMGHQPDPNGLAAVALGAMIFSVLYFAFNFLRMSTTGLAAQASGAEDWDEFRALLLRAGGLAIAIGVLLFAFQGPLAGLAFWAIEGEAQVETLSQTYFQVRIWGAPAALLNFAFLGWFFGLGDMRLPVLLQLAINLMNVALSLFFVLGLDWGVEGVAAATAVSEWFGVALGLFLARRVLRQKGGIAAPLDRVFSGIAIWRLMAVNRDIFIRSACLLAAFAHFKATGAEIGTLTLAANAVLMIFLDICAYGLDALANAAEILVGKAVGRKDRTSFNAVVRQIFILSGLAALAITVIFFLSGGWIVGLITTQETVRATASPFIPWAALVPVVAVWCFILDGIFIGATRSAALRNGMLIATSCYFLGQYFLLEVFGNHGLWAALHIFMLARGLTLAAALPSLSRSIAQADQTKAPR